MQFLGIVAVIGMVAAAFNGLGSNAFRNDSSNTGSPDDVIATVNGDPLTRSAFQEKLTKMTQRQTMSIMASANLNATAIDQAADDILTVQLAKAKHLTVTKSDLDKARAATVSAIAVELGLSPKASESEVSDKLHENGMTFEQYFNEDEQKQTLLFRKYGQYLENANKVTETDARNQYTDYRTAHILIDNKKRPDAQALDQAKKLIDQLNKGADFTALAKQYSDDTGTKNRGGDDGWVTKDTNYVPEFLNAMKTLHKGQITQEPVVSPRFGYFIIKLNDTRSSIPKDFDKNKAQIIAQLQNSKIEEAYRADLDKAHASEKLVVKDNRYKLDHGAYDLRMHPGPDGRPDQGELAKLIKGYTALAGKTKDKTELAQIYAEIGQLQGMTNEKDPKVQAKQEIAAYEAALSAYGRDDVGLDEQLMTLYQQIGDKAKAIKYAQAASANTFDSPEAHKSFASTFNALGRPDLAAKENQIAAQEAAQTSAHPGGPAGMPITVSPPASATAPATAPPPGQPSAATTTVGGKPVPAGAISLHPSSSAVHPSPGQIVGSQRIEILPGGKIKLVGPGMMNPKPGAKPIVIQAAPGAKPAPAPKPAAVVTPAPKPAAPKPATPAPAPAPATPAPAPKQ